MRGVVGEEGVNLAEGGRVLTNLLEVRAAPACSLGCGKQRRQPPRMLLKALDAEQLDVGRSGAIFGDVCHW